MSKTNFASAIIEMPAGTDHKYEWREKSARLHLDRIVNQKIPENYGFIPNTLSEDGDALDTFVISDLPIIPGASCTFFPMAVILCMDNGLEDNKIVGVLEGEPVHAADFECRLQNIVDYLNTYKKGFEVTGVINKPAVAVTVVKEALDAHIDADKNV